MAILCTQDIMGPLALLIPALMWTFEHIIGPLTEDSRSSILSKLGSLAVSSNLGSDIMAIFGEQMSNASAQQKNDFQLAMTALVGQIALNQTEAKSPSFFISGARPFLFWGLSIALLMAVLIEPTINYVLAFAGIHTPAVFELSNMAMGMLSGLCGLHIAGRTFEKYQGVD